MESLRGPNQTPNRLHLNGLGASHQGMALGRGTEWDHVELLAPGGALGGKVKCSCATRSGVGEHPVAGPIS